MEVERTPLISRGRSDTSKARSSVTRKETPKKRDNLRAVSVAESLQECDDHLIAISKCEK